MQKANNKTAFILWVSFFLLTVLGGCQGAQAQEAVELEKVHNDNKEEKETPSTLKEEKPEKIYVHVCGQVGAPGVYELPQGSRVFEALTAAGGLLDEAEGEALNQAEAVEDGQRVYVPARGEVVQSAADTASGTSLQPDDGKVNINIASEAELMTLNGIGQARASSIITYREAQGGFRSIEELKEIEGIKDGVFNKLKDQIKIN